MNENIELIPANEKQEYHNCEMIFSLYLDNKESDFKISKEQKYSIHTTIKEVEVLNESLHVYQADGFKEKFLLYTQEIDGNRTFPEFTPSFNKVTALGKQLQALANDDDKLIQLQEYYLEIVPTYRDDFMINKEIEAIIIDSHKREINGYEDLKSYISELKQNKPELFA